jgi:hypothetical protein
MDDLTTRRWFFGAAAVGAAGVPATAAALDSALAERLPVSGALQDADASAFRQRLGVVPAVSVEQYGARAGDALFDSTDAIHEAIAALAALGGGQVVFESNQSYYANIILTGNNIALCWRGGRAAFNTSCLRPFDPTRPPLTIGDDVTLTRNCALINANISGVRNGGDPARAADNAPAAVHIKGNVAILEVQQPCFYGGLVTLKMIPSVTTPVTGINFWGGEMRNDVIDSAAARTIYATYPTADGYYTDVKFWGVKINGPHRGYVAEFDRSALFQASGVYFDMPGSLAASKGLLFTNGGAGLFHGVTLDPLGHGQLIIETTDVTTDMNRVVQGDFRHGGQKWKNGAGTVFDIPDEANAYHYKMSLRSPHIRLPINLSRSTDHFSTTEYLDMRTDLGPLDLFGADFSVRTTTEAVDLDTAALQTNGGLSVRKRLRVGTDAIVGGTLTVGGQGGVIRETGEAGGLRIEAAGRNQDIQLVPSGSGHVVLRGGGLIPQTGTAVIGAVGRPIADFVGSRYSDAGGEQLLGPRGAAVADALPAARAPTAAEFNALVTQFNTLLARCRAHGLIQG